MIASFGLEQASAATGTGSTEPPSLTAFVEATTNFTLDPWQRILCARLERLRHERGQRLLIHAAPQHGKSILVSQRFPAWLLGCRPLERIKLACYNITHATRFGWMLRDVMSGSDYAAMFPGGEALLPGASARGEWSTAARSRLKDAQPSFMALGLLTGFVGQGADTLIIDDPYASPQDALSEVIRENVWTFWNEGARVRLNDDTNVVAMFHRYHEDDLAGRLLREGGWEELRFAARAEENDPAGRQIGERLSPRYSESFYDEQERNSAVWLGQFQGRPTAKEGAFFKVGMLQIEDAAPAGLRCCRAWDLAATEGAGDWTAGVKIGTDGEGRFWVLDVCRGRWSTDERNRILKQTAALDGSACRIHMPQDPGQAGKDQAAGLVRLLAGYSVKAEPVSGAKDVRADPFSAQVNAGNVRLVEGPWNKAFIEELRVFPLGTNDDQVDAAGDAFTELTSTTPLRFYTL